MLEWLIAFSAGVAATVVGGQILDVVKNYDFKVNLDIRMKRK